MAFFKIVPEQYTTEDDLRQLIHYTIGKSCYIVSNNLITANPDIITNQMLFEQAYRKKPINNRALHFVFSLDTSGWENYITLQNVIHIADYIRLHDFFKEYQQFAAVHNKQGQLHFHWIINPVNYETGNLLHFNITEYNKLRKELAISIYYDFRLALSETSFIKKNGDMVFCNDTPVPLYQNRQFPYIIPKY